MRQEKNFIAATESMSAHCYTSQYTRQTRSAFWRGGLIETLAALRFRDETAYEEWLQDRDISIIAAKLSSLSSRQLALIGLGRETLVMGIDDLRRRTEREREITMQALELFEDRDDSYLLNHDDADTQKVAAE